MDVNNKETPSEDLKAPKIFKHPEKDDQKDLKAGAKSENWETINVGSGVYRGMDTRQNRQGFMHHMREDVKDVFSKFSKQDAFAKAVREEMHGGKLTKTGMRKAIDKMGKLGATQKQLRNLRGKFGARSSSIL